MAKKQLEEIFPQELMVGMVCNETVKHDSILITLSLNEKGLHKLGGGG